MQDKRKPEPVILNRENLNTKKQEWFVYIVLSIVTLAVYWQVNRFDFVNFDDYLMVTENYRIQSSINQDTLRWAFTTNHADLWSPLLWVSFLLDYQLYGLNAGGYHVTNLILHILSALLLFWLFNRMTKAIWPSAFVAAVFALHPLHVESVAWITERKDVLSAFFWMLTLCLYAFYTEKPVLKRYLLVLFSFICALMSKSMVITLPAIMVLLDYWPLNRFEPQKSKSNLILWQLKEKAPFFILSAIFAIVTFYIQYYFPSVQNDNSAHHPLHLRLANASVSFVTYLEKTFWPHDMAAFYPFVANVQAWKVIGSLLLILAITAFVIIMIKRMPYLIVGWLWFSITILPVIKILQIGKDAMADRYHYLPSIGIAIMVAWGIPWLFHFENLRKKILAPAAVIFLTIMTILAWLQCSYWRNSVALFNHALKVTHNNYVAHNCLALASFEGGKTEEIIKHFDISIQLQPDNFMAYNGRGMIYSKIGQYNEAIEDYNKAININPKYYYIFKAYNNIGIAYAQQGQYKEAINDFNKAIALKPGYSDAYYNRGVAYANMGRYQQAIEDYNKSIMLKPGYTEAYYNRGVACTNLGEYQSAIDNYDKAIHLKLDYVDAYYNRGINQSILGRYESAIADFNQTINLKKDDADAYNSRAIAYLNLGNRQLGCSDAKKACSLKVCEAFKLAKEKGLCR